MRPPRKLSSEADLYNAALRALMRRAHSVHELRIALERRCDDAALVRRVMARLKEAKLLDYARYAKQIARHRAEARRQGRFRIARDLRGRGVPDRHIDAALDEAFAETDEAAVLHKRIERKLRLLRGPLDDRRLASLYRSLLRSGFSTDLIRAELRALTRRDPGEIPVEDSTTEL